MKKLITIILILAVLVMCSAYADPDLYAVQVPKDEKSTYVLNILKTAEKIYLLCFDFDLDTNGYPYTEKDGVVTIQMDGDIHEAHITNDGFDYPLNPEGPYIMMYPAKPGSSAGSADISGLSFDELVKTKEQINTALWDSQGWKEVEVTAGVWEIGKDIPAGHWTISMRPGRYTQIFYCEKVKPVELRPDNSGESHTTVIAAPDSSAADLYPQSYSYDMKEGCYFICDDTVVFTPYAGPDFSFN